MVPTSLRVLGILGIIYAALGLIGVAYALVQFLAVNPILDNLQHDGLYVGVTMAGLAIGGCMALLLLASSIGCFKARPWARTGMNIYAVSQIVTSLAGMIFNIMYVFPKMDWAKAVPAGAGAAPSVTLFQTLALASAVIGVLVGLTVVVVILILVNRKIAVDAFHGIFPAGPTNFPVDYTPPLA